MNKSELSTKKTLVGIILAVASLLDAQLVAQVLSAIIFVLQLPEWIGYVVYGCLYVGFAYIFIGLVCKKVLGLTRQQCRIGTIAIHKIWLVCAVALPMVVTIILLCMPGKWEQGSIQSGGAFLVIVTALFYYGIGAGIVEEMVFRGLMMTVIEKRFGKKLAIIMPSMLFGLVHTTSGMGGKDVLQLFVAGTSIGIMFSLIVYENQSVWASAIVHAVWNIVMVGNILNIGVSPTQEALFKYKLELDSRFITGGSFGIEASAVAILGYILISVLGVFLIKKKDRKKSLND